MGKPGDGDDACTLFNVNDVFTGRPMRTYFRDKQVHISADVAYGIWQYYMFTGDESILLDGGAEAVWECARFFTRTVISTRASSGMRFSMSPGLMNTMSG